MTKKFAKARENVVDFDQNHVNKPSSLSSPRVKNRGSSTTQISMSEIKKSRLVED